MNGLSGRIVVGYDGSVDGRPRGFAGVDQTVQDVARLIRTLS